jgi:hypothetical protein
VIGKRLRFTSPGAAGIGVETSIKDVTPVDLHKTARFFRSLKFPKPFLLNMFASFVLYFRLLPRTPPLF